MLAYPSWRYEANPKQWSELSYEVSRGELRMEAYLIFLNHMGCLGRVVKNFFGGLKPIVAALVNSSQHSIFLYFFDLVCVFTDILYMRIDERF